MEKLRRVTSKGCKVTDRNRSKIIGVAANSLSQLCAKGKEKLGLGGPIVVALEDGTLVEDEEYFATVQPHTLFILYRHQEPIISGVDIILSALKGVNSTYLTVGADAAKFMEEKTDELHLLLDQGDTTPCTDPDWFIGLETNATTKEDYMNKKAQDRVRGYLYKCQDDVRKSQVYLTDCKVRKMLTDCIAEFKKRLVSDGYFGCYFDRRCVVADQDKVDGTSLPPKKMKKDVVDSWSDMPDSAGSFCDASGTFRCEGLWKLNYCGYSGAHLINPYLTREARIIFSTWNLDHRIEKSRTIVPALIEAARRGEEGGGKVNVGYFYALLFTRSNLRLVHIVCHDKKSHDMDINRNLAYCIVANGNAP